MIAIDLNGTIKTFSRLPKVWSDENGTHLNITDGQAFGFYPIVTPSYDSATQYLGDLEWDGDASVFTYPVFYMHDAQNLFDAKTSYVGEWKVDEYLNSISKNEVIVIGIEHGNEKRIEELTPFPNKKYGGGNGDNYLLFIKNTLKPHIDISYRTKPEAKYTTIIGSSLGGLISYYAALKYPNTFGKAGVFSPSFWFSDKIIDFTQNTNLETHTKLYFLIGSDEGKEVISDMENIISLLIQKGFPKDQLKKEVINGGKHNEAFWSSYFPSAHQWLILD